MFLNKNIPDALYLDLTNICNANCIFCAYQYDNREKKELNTELIKKVLKEYKEVGGLSISLSPLTGEIFTDSKVLEKINLIKDFNFKFVYAYTNALLLHKFKFEEILNSGLHQLNISLSVLDEVTFKKMYRNKNYSQLLNNISSFLDKFNNTKNKTIKKVSIEFRTNLSFEETIKLPDYKKYILPYLNENIAVGYINEYDSWMGQIKETDLLPGMKLKKITHDNFPCSRLNMLQVLSNGETRICGCRYSNNNIDIFNIGDANSENIIEMYNKPKVSIIKEDFKKGTLPKECQTCSMYTKNNYWVQVPNIKFNDFEDWNKKLTNAIEKHTKININNNSSFWEINTINIQNSIEREMYFNFITKYEYFFKILNEQTIPHLRKFKSDILSLMLNREITTTKSNKTSQNKTFKIKKIKTNNFILFSVVSLKFLKYIEPILNKLKNEFILIGQIKSEDFSNYISKKGYAHFFLEDFNFKHDIVVPEHLKGLYTVDSMNTLYNVLKDISPKILVTIEGSNPREDLMSRIAKKMGIKAICIQQGYAPFYPIGYRNMIHDKFLTWGEFFSEDFRKYNPDCNFINVGNHQLSLKTKINNEIHTITFFTQGVKYYITEKDFENFNNFIISSAKKYKNIKFLIREHPSQPLPEQIKKAFNHYKNIQFANFNTHSIKDVLLQSDLAISISSSALIEALGMNVPSIFINDLFMYNKFKEDFSFIPFAKEIPEAEQLLKDLLEDNKSYKNILKQLSLKNIFFAKDRNAVDNIINEIKFV